MADAWKYPKDLYDTSVDWEGPQVLPIGATSLVSVVIVITDPTLGSPNEVPSLLSGEGVDGYVSYGIIQNGVIGKTYTVLHRVTFNNTRVLDKYLTLEIRSPRKNPTQIFKYPADVFEVATKWNDRMPRGAGALGPLTVKAYDSADSDVTSTYIEWGQVVGMFSVAKIKGGTGGEDILLEFAQDFSNGRRFHEYVLLTVRVPPA